MFKLNWNFDLPVTDVRLLLTVTKLHWEKFCVSC